MKKNISISAKLFLSLFAIFVSFETFSQTFPYQNDYALGLDLSFVKQGEDRGTKYYDVDGTEKPALQIFREHGYNWSRVMICNEPTRRLPQDLEYVVDAAKSTKEYGYFFLLDMMFSNGWANPMEQPTPSLWVDMSHKERVEAVYEYVHRVVSRLKDEGVMPDMIQIGNEIGNGFLWPDGRINYATPEQSKWENVADYLKAGVKAIRELEDDEKKIKIMIHVDHGGDLEMSQTFFDNMNKYKVDYDVIGYSFYPWSHGTLLDLRDNLRMTALRFKKEIIVVETGYYYRQSNYFEDVKPPFPETPEGQKEWFQAVNEIVLATPNGLGKGVFWWHPVSGSRGFFDTETNVAKPIVEAFERYGLPVKRADGQTRIQ
ncbi:MAG TPA: glycosyl hydrolase 53 family protein [Draconibacterium sp.]|nr:glycosyl hydrolase 53 family protein [Draconibacterium sp.]